MGEIIDFLKRSVKKTAKLYSAEAKEISRIKKMPRYKQEHTNLLGDDFTFVDSASFIGQYFSVLNGDVYNFKADTDSPYIVDCGANIGMSILYFKKKYPKANIVAFEPDERIYSVLKKNIESRGFDDVTLVNKGVWNYDGKMEFISEGADGGSILASADTQLSNVPITEIIVTSLRPYLQKKVDFLKIDIEGAEAVVMEDCEDLLHNVQRIFIEYHSIVNAPQRLNVILNVLGENGFRYYIESGILNNESPFVERSTLNNFDNFLNIYAYK